MAFYWLKAAALLALGFASDLPFFYSLATGNHHLCLRFLATSEHPPASYPHNAKEWGFLWRESLFFPLIIIPMKTTRTLSGRTILFYTSESEKTANCMHFSHIFVFQA